MSYRQLKPKKTQEEEEREKLEREEILPEEFRAYLRQSSDKQVRENIESIELQLSGYQREAIKRGLDAKKIVAAHEGEGKRGVSGTLRIDQREKLKEIMADVYAGKVKVIWAYSVSRLFRDKYGTQVATFIQACADHHVKVVIENAKVFDFTEWMDRVMFQFLANVAARENEERSKLLHSANNEKAKAGFYGGGQLHPGYIVDRDEDSETFMRYIPYGPHAEITARLYKRFRELRGRYNVFASEVAQMSILYPPFEPCVDKRNVNQFRLKKVCKLHGKLCDCDQEDCELVGYHITDTALRRLLAHVEYTGYWKFHKQVIVDEDGKPKKNHTAIVPLDDWQYAFNRMSPVTLTGEENTERTITNTWSPVKKARPTTLLEGILTSPLGNIWCTDNRYNVTEQQDGKMHRTKTLAVPTLWIDAPFRHRLQQRLHEDLAGNKNFLQEQLKRIKANNAEALVSVDQQIANYRKAIANREDFIVEMGNEIDKETKRKYNEDNKKDRAQLAALLVKKNAANEEVEGVEELIDRIGMYAAKEGKHTLKTKKGEFPARWGDDIFIEGDEDTRRFIRLAVESVELNKYSGHVFTLTIRWRAPFAQTDVCYIYRQGGGHQAWTKEDEQVLRDLYPHADRCEVMQALPTRSWKSIVTWANLLGLKRKTMRNTTGIEDMSL